MPMTAPSRCRPHARLAAWAVLVALLFGGGAAASRSATTDRELEPPPPWIFFPDPDAETAAEISQLVENSFGDINKTALARELLVRRYGLWSVQKLHRVMKEETNESRTWNAALTASALRDRLGNAPQLWPLLDPLADLADHSAEPYRRAFAALALGSFHGPAFIPPPPRHPDPLIVRRPERDALRHLEDGIATLGRLVGDGNPSVEVAAAIALAKSGAPDARALVRAAARLNPTTDRDVSSVEARMATLVAVGLLPRDEDDGLLLPQLRSEETPIRAAAALAVALQALSEPTPAWIESPGRILRALNAPDKIKLHLQDGAEATFARGALALRAGARPEWRGIFDLAVTPSVEETTKRAAAQCLLFCPEPWVTDQMLDGIRKADEPTVVAAFLLRLAAAATPEAIEACDAYLSNSRTAPKAEPDWDVRFYATLGLLRALASGRVTDRDRRHAIYEALDHAASRGLARGPFRERLRDILETEKRGILESETHIVPERHLEALEATFDDEPGLLSRDMRDAVVVRLNDIVPQLFSVNVLRPGEPGNRDKSEMPRRFFAQYHDRYPYFSRLDLRADRGRRPWPRMPAGDDPEREVRRP